MTFAVEDDTTVSGGLASVNPWSPPGVKVRGAAALEGDAGGLRIRITPEVIWSWGINVGAESRFKGVERRDLREGGQQ